MKHISFALIRGMVVTIFRAPKIEEIIQNPDNIVLIVWAEKATNLIPKNTIKIVFETVEQTKRKITVL